jgi:hypothetical protein
MNGRHRAYGQRMESPLASEGEPRRRSASRSLRLGLACLGISVAGWAAIVVVAVFFPGGHPPLAAYVAIPVLLAMIPASAAGLITTGISLRDGAGAALLKWVSLVGNGLALASPATLLLR